MVLEGQKGSFPETQEKWAVPWLPDRTDDLIPLLLPSTVVFSCCTVPTVELTASFRP